MAKLLTYPFSFLYYCFFSSCLLLFHPLQVISLRWLGLNAQKKTVDILNFFLLRCLNLLGTRISFQLSEPLPEQGTLIFASNHQSTYDIPPLIWYLRKYHPKFVAKKELGKGLPSISYHLREGGNVLIDRKAPADSLKRITHFAQSVHQNNWSVIIFPEGTRTRNGQPKKFQRAGLRTLLEHIPDAVLVPISINNSWKLAQWNYFPMPLGVRLDLKVHQPIHLHEMPTEKAIDFLEEQVKKGIKN
ncbi:MAG: lysophospholipid acyltransferase family protein [Flavobacteriaceae bacterium]